MSPSFRPHLQVGHFNWPLTQAANKLPMATLDHPAPAAANHCARARGYGLMLQVGRRSRKASYAHGVLINLILPYPSFLNDGIVLRHFGLNEL